MRERISLARCASRPSIRLFIAVLALGFMSINSIYAQPANDDCTSAQVVPTDGSCYDGNNFLATSDIGNGDCVANGFNTPNVWFQFTAQGADYDISGFGLGGSMEFTLLQFQGTACTFADAVQFDCGAGQIVGTDALVAGQVYYVVLTSSNTGAGATGPYSICVDNPADPPPPPNDNPCSAQPTPADGSCSSGTTVNATTDWSNPNCNGLGENSVWYSVTLAAGSNAIDVNLGSGDIGGDASMMIGQFATDCTSGFSFVGQYCGPPNTTLNVPGLTGGQTYFIVVSTEEANAGTFDVCVTEIGANPACAPNDPCSGAQDLSGVPVQNVCAQGCTDGVSPDNTGGAGCSDFSGDPTVWYSFTTDATTALVSISMTSPDFDQGQVALFQGGCAGFVPVDCNIGAGGAVNLQNVAVTPNTSYLIAVASLAGQVGSFNLCVLYQGAGGTNCITSGDVVVTNTSLGSPISGPFLPNETVSFCMNINWTSSGNNCQWLHGIVPEFGECWSDASFDASTGMPIAVTAPLPGANWYTDGEVTYNDIPAGALPAGAPVGAGWFVVGVNNNGNLPMQCPPGAWITDPNCSYGVSMACNSTASYSVCFDLTTKSFAECDADPASINCGVSFKTYGDGETGGWGSAGCEADIPIIGNYSLNCCIGPELVPSSFTACSDVQLDIFLEDLVLPPSDPLNLTYTWTVSAPASVSGASDCLSGCPSVISQILVNTSGSSQFVTYEITAESLDGCPGIPTTVTVEVLPSIMPSISQPSAVCSGQCVQLFGSATGGDGNFSYEWENSSTGIFTEVCPSFTTTYSLTVTDGNGCTGVASVTVEANPNFDVLFFPDSYVPICAGEPQPPLTATGTLDPATNPIYTFNWELPGPPFNSASPIITPDFPGDNIYYVTLTDINSGCTGEGEINIIVNESPLVIAWTDQDSVCQGTDPLNILGGIPTGGTWSGNVNADGWFVPDTPGSNILNYSFTNLEGCSDSFDVEIIVLPTPDLPVFQPATTNICQNATATFCVDPVNGATSYAWTLPVGVTINGASNGECVEIVWGASMGGDICVMGVNDCGDGPEACLSITISPTPPAALAINGLNPVCLDQDDVTYSIDAVAGATGYTWTVNPGTFTGSGTSIEVDWGIGATGEICVTPYNDCGDGPQLCETINFIDPPVDPGAPTGPDACSGETGVIFTTTGSPDATTYTWQVTGGSIASGDGTNTIEIDWGNGGSGIVCVTANNNCGSSNQVCTNVNLNTVPANAGLITGPDLVCQNTADVTYSIDVVGGATGYTWSVPTGVTLVSGQGTESITVDFGVFSSGQICVEAFNDCGPSNPACITIDPDLIPVAPDQLPDDVLCADDTDISYTVNVPGANSYNWQLPAGVTMVTGASSGTVGFNVGTASSGPVCVSAINDCGEGPAMCFDLIINDVPAQPTDVQYNPTICEGANNETYTVQAVNDATGYVWTVPTGASIISGQGTQTITVDWGAVLGGEICVAAENDCGTGNDFCFNVAADQPLALPTIQCDLNATSLVEVGFTITHPVATDFVYYYSVDGGALEGPFTWTANPVIVPTSANQDVEIFVTALANGNVCGDSQEASQTCTANDCTNNPPTIDAPTALFCPDSPAYQLNASPAGGTFSGTGVTATGLFTPTGPGSVIITYEYTDANQCPQTNTIVLDVNDFPVANAGADAILSCAQTNIQLDGGGSSTGAGIEYLWSGPGVLPGAETSISPLIDGTGTYTLTVTNTITGCSATDQVDVDPDTASPTADAGTMQTITCDNPMVTLMGTGANGSNLTYLWTGPGITPANENEPQPVVNATGNYTLVVTAGNGCASAPSDVMVDEAIPPVAAAGADQDFFCSTTDIDLDATAGTTSGSTIQYLWTGPGNITNPNSLTPNVDAAGTYVLLVTDTATGCTDTDEVILIPDTNAPTATPVPTASITCFVPMATLQGSGSATNMSYLWTGPGITPANETLQNPMVNMPGNYYLQVTDDDNGCTSAAELVVVDQAQDPMANAGTDGSLTCAFPTLELMGTATIDPDVTYLWTGPGTIIDETTLTPVVNVAGTFTLTATNNVTGCFASSDVILTPDSNAPMADAGADQLLTCIVTDVTLQGMGTNGTGVPLEYTWSGPGITPANENDQNPVVNVDGQYFLTVFNPGNGCTSAGSSVMVNVPSPILVAVAGPATFTCADNNLQLDGTGTTTGMDMEYLWTGPGTIDNANTLNPTIYTNGSFTLTATNIVTGCSESLTHIVNPDLGAPTVAAGMDTFIDCNNGSANLSVTTNAVTPLYTWSGPGINAGNMNLQNPTVTEPGMYFVQVEDDANGCDNTDQMEVADLRALPVANAGTSITKGCLDPTVTLNGNNSDSGTGITYLWTGPGTILNETTLDPIVDASGTFTLTVINTATGCQSTATVDVLPDTNAPVAMVNPDDELDCNNDFQFTLQGSTTSSSTNLLYTWTGPGITTANMNMENPTVTVQGQYELVITDQDNGCESNTAIVNLTEAVPPVASINSGGINTIDCVFDNLTLVAVGCGTDPNLIFEWYLNGLPLPDGCEIELEMGDPDGLFQLVVTDALTGCSDTASTNVVDNSEFPGAMAGDDQVIDCENEEVQLVGSSLLPTGVSYLWTGPLILSDPTQPTITVGAQGEYVLTVVESISGCENTDAVFVEDISLALQADAGDDQVLDCTYAPIQLVGNSSGGTGLDFSWYNQAGELVGQSEQIEVTEPGTYSLEVFNPFNSCDTRDDVVVNPPDNLPTDFDLNLEGPDCPEEENGFVNVLEVLGGTQPFNFALNDVPLTGPLVTGLAPGDYTLWAMDANECEIEQVITIPNPPDVAVVLDEEIVELEFGDSTTVTANITVPLTDVIDISWFPANAVECLTPLCDRVQIRADFPANVSVQITTADGCVAEDQLEVKVSKDFNVYFPNVFSPAGVGPASNNFFRPYTNRKVVKIEDFIIADRWGEIVYRAEDFNFNDPAETGWDGTLRGRPLNPAVFVYYARVTFIDGSVEEFAGDVTLLR